MVLVEVPLQWSRSEMHR